MPETTPAVQSRGRQEVGRRSRVRGPDVGRSAYQGGSDRAQGASRDRTAVRSSRHCRRPGDRRARDRPAASEVETVVVPVGGGGLISGVVTAWRPPGARLWCGESSRQALPSCTTRSRAGKVVRPRAHRQHRRRPHHAQHRRRPVCRADTERAGFAGSCWSKMTVSAPPCSFYGASASSLSSRLVRPPRRAAGRRGASYPFSLRSGQGLRPAKHRLSATRTRVAGPASSPIAAQSAAIHMPPLTTSTGFWNGTRRRPAARPWWPHQTARQRACRCAIETARRRGYCHLRPARPANPAPLPCQLGKRDVADV